jgi:hypothetical protein
MLLINLLFNYFDSKNPAIVIPDEYITYRGTLALIALPDYKPIAQFPTWADEVYELSLFL